MTDLEDDYDLQRISARTEKTGMMRFRLCGEVGDRFRRFDLVSGGNPVGSARESRVRLARPGVSRHHAEIIVGTRSLRVEDRSSKNGTMVNGVAVTRQSLEPGDTVAFGPVALVVETVTADDAELALRLDLPREPSTVLASGVRTPSQRIWLDRDAIRVWFEVVDAFVDRLSLAPSPDTSGALRSLIELLGAEGAAAYETSADRARVLLGASGKIGDPPSVPGFDAPGFNAVGGTPSTSFVYVDEAVPLTLASFGTAADGVTLVTWGGFPARERAEALFRILVRLLARYRRASLHRQTGDTVASVPGLVLPKDYVVGAAPATTAMHQHVATLAQGDLPVLLVGETGTGKEHIARILHDSTRGRGGPFVALNCAAMPAELLEAELFGIGKGVATGVAARSGLFQQAAGGTVFLDEIGEMSLALQPKLLRVLQERTIRPVGGGEQRIDVRVVAATNIDLAARAQAGEFRPDLYYRLAGAVVRVPALRDRREDIPALVEAFLVRACSALGKPVRGLSVAAMATLAAAPWPGNIRQLENEVERLVYACPPGEAIESTMIAADLAAPDGSAAGTSASDTSAPDTPKDLLASLVGGLEDLDLDAIERAVVEEALGRTGGNQVQAGKLLGISRTAVRRRLARFDDP